MSNTAIRVQDLGKRYRIGQSDHLKNFRDVVTDTMSAPFRRLASLANRSADGGDANEAASDAYFWAVRDVSLEVNHGDVLGIIGRNGAGKSTLLKMLSRITEPTEGYAELHGRVGSLLEVGTGFHPELTGRENIYLNGIILGMKKVEIDRKFDEIVAFSEVEKFLDTPVKRYSSGMYVRLAFAVAAHLEPEILIVDEVLAVGDTAFQKKCLGKMGDIAREGRTVLFVSHNMNAIQRLCPKSLVLEHGRVVGYGRTSDIVGRYLASAITEAAPASWIDVSQISREGTGQVRVSSIQYSSGNEAVDCQPYTRGPLEVTFAIEANAPLAVGSIAVTLYDKNGTKLVNADTLTLGRIAHLQLGRNVVQLRIEELYLNPGVYTLGWWLGDPLGGVVETLNGAFDFVESGFTIEVVELESQGLGVKPKSDGFVPCAFDMLEIK